MPSSDLHSRHFCEARRSAAVVESLLQGVEVLVRYSARSCSGICTSLLCCKDRAAVLRQNRLKNGGKATFKVPPRSTGTLQGKQNVAL